LRGRSRSIDSRLRNAMPRKHSSSRIARRHEAAAQEPRRDPTDAPSRRSRALRDPLVLALTALALLYRLWGVGDRLPDPTLGINVFDDSAVEETDRATMGWAWKMWAGGTRKPDLNPHMQRWPGFSLYFGLGIQVAYKGAYLISHPGSGTSDFVRFVRDHPERLFLFGRIMSVLVGVLTVLLAFRVGARLRGRWAGLFAGLFVALNPLHAMISQRIADPNLLALLFTLLASVLMTRIAVDGSSRASIAAGAWIGLAGACKYVPLVLALPLAAAHGSRFFRQGRFYLALLACATALFLASPFTFLDWRQTVHDVATQRRNLLSDWVGQTTSNFSLPTYLGVILPHVMGWPAYLLGLVGMGLLWNRGGRAERAVVSIAAVMVLANGALRLAQERYMLVAIPILFVGTAFALVSVHAWGVARVGPRKEGRDGHPATLARAEGWIGSPVVLGLLATCALAWPLPEYSTTRRELALPDTRHVAQKWIQDHIPPNRPMALELYGPVLQTSQRAVVIWPFAATRTELVRPAYHHEYLDGLDYYVLSREILRRFEADSLKYPVEIAFYRWISAHAPLVWRTDPRTASGPEIEVRRVPGVISTRAERDSVFEAALPGPSGVRRVAIWCADFAAMEARLGRPDREEEWAKRGIQVGASDLMPKLFAMLAHSFLDQGRFRQAEEAARLGMARSPRDAPLHYFRAMALQQLGTKEEALAEYQAAYNISRDPSVILDVARAARDLGRYDEAVALLDRVPADHPERGPAMEEKGLLLITKMGRPAEGVAALAEAARLEPNPERAAQIQAAASRVEAQLQRGPAATRTRAPQVEQRP
jgi:tetratricopeptide (TPR) repeat protein